MRRLLLLLLTAVVVGQIHPAGAQAVDQSEVMKPGPLREMVFGDANAPVTVIEYTSLTCHHCQDFHKKTWPAVRAKYVDTGKIRFILREFPLDQLAMAGFMLARCSGDEKWYSVIDVLYQNSAAWEHSDKPLDALSNIMRQTGMTRAELETCLSNERLFEDIKQIRERASKTFRVASTPTFFINGNRHAGAPTLDQFSKLVDPLLTKTP